MNGDYVTYEQAVKQFYKATDFKDFSPRKGFVCGEYFNC